MASRDCSYRADSPACATDAQGGVPQVVFYQLSTKFVDSEESVPEDAQDVLYYTLAVGHHTGVIDCFEERLRMPLEVYERFTACFADDEAARYKLEAVQRHWEVQIDRSNLDVLVPAFEKLKQDPPAALTGDEEVAQAFDGLCTLISVLQANSSAYIMGRLRRP